MAFFYFRYDVEKGRFLYLEDLYIEKRYRGNGRGTLVMATLASIQRTSGAPVCMASLGLEYPCLEIL
jgi:GNAT superfamily N-acetyltransferase